MAKSQETIGFGRGRSVDQQKRFREEMLETDLEQQGEAEEIQDIEQGLQQFELGLAKIPNDDRGRDWASIYIPVIDQIDSKLLSDPRFWKHALIKHGYEIGIAGLFSALPAGVQSIPEIQQIFFSQPDFSTMYVPRAVMERVEPELAREKWSQIRMTEDTFGRAPWKQFTPEQKRKLVDEALGANVSIYAMDVCRNDFSDAIPVDEWNTIAREKYRNDQRAILEAIKGDDLGRLQELLTNKELRSILSSPARGKTPAYMSLTLPVMREIEFSENDVTNWQFNQREQTALSSGFDGFEKMTPEDREWALSLIPDRAKGYKEEYQNFIRQQLPKIIQQLPPAAVSHNLNSVADMMYDTWELPPKEVVDGVIRPTLESQGASAFRTFGFLRDSIWDSGHQANRSILDIMVPDEGSAKLLRYIQSKTGARFQDFLEFYQEINFAKDSPTDTTWYTVFGQSLGTQQNLAPYLDSKLPWTRQLYNDFSSRLKSGQTIKDVVREMSAEVGKAIAQIQSGVWPEGGLDEEKLGLLSHVFPPALGVSREEYARLVQRRKDRQDDIPPEWETLQGETVSFPVGKWELAKGETFELSPWNRIGEAVADVNDKKVITEEKEQVGKDEILMSQVQIVEVGRRMVRILTESSSASTKAALRDGYALFLARGGTKLPDFVSGREEAARLTEWSKDALRDVIDAALRAYHEADPVTFEAEVTAATRREISPKAKKAMTKSIVGMLGNQRMTAEQKSERMRVMLKDLGVAFEGDPYEQVRSSIEGIEDKDVLESAVAAIVELMLFESEGTTTEAGKVSSQIVTKILGSDGPAMDRQLEKWLFIEGAEGGEQRQIRFEISKRKLHAVAGLNMGVCVAVDDQLWNKEDFSNVIMFGDDGVARGGMHFEIVQDGKKKYLSLPGINPSLTMLREVSGERVLRAMIDFAKRSAQAIKAESVLIPTNPTIFTNREELHGLVREMKLPTKSLSEHHQFSYAPFAYSWQDGYEIPAK